MRERFSPWLKKHFSHARRPQQPGAAARQSATSQASRNILHTPQVLKNSSTAEREPQVDVSPVSGNPATANNDLAPAGKQGSARVPSRPERLWDEAYDVLKKDQAELVEAYEKILSSQLEHGIGSSVPETQQNLIDQIDPDKRRQQMKELIEAGLDHTAREARIKERISTITDVVVSAKNIISAAIVAAPQAAIAWTGVCVALELLLNPVAATKANRLGLEYVIRRMEWYWSLAGDLFKDSASDTDPLAQVGSELERQVVILYKALLTYQMKSVYSFYRNRGLVFLRDMVRLDDWEGDLKAILDLQGRFDHDSLTYSARQQVSLLGQLLRSMKDQETTQLSDKDRECLRALWPSDPYDEKSRIEGSKGGLLQDSYRWILQNPEFCQWRDQPGHSLLWIRGDPGKGKTMLLCGLIDELRNSTPSSVVSFFFCQATDRRLKHATGVLRGLIYLLVSQQRTLLAHLQEKYNHQGISLFESPNAWYALSEIFRTILQDRDLKPVYLVVDALDECENSDLPQLLKLIVDMSKSPHVKWIVSSRNWPNIERQLAPTEGGGGRELSLEINSDLVSHSVDVYIDHKVSQLIAIQYDEKLRDQVRQSMRQKANGTFLWVALVIQELQYQDSAEYEDPEELLKTLDAMPSDLIGLYTRMIHQISLLKGADPDRCRILLATVALAYRPLHLSELGTLAGFRGNLNKLDTLERLVCKCGSFLTIRDNVVYFVHQSAKDFLIKDTNAFNDIFPSRHTEHVHYNMFSNSLKVMTATLHRDMYNLSHLGTPIDKINTVHSDPLTPVRYSCVYWVEHLCDSLSSQMTNQVKDLGDGGSIHTFLETKYLYWLEALSLLRSMSAGVMAIRKLEERRHEMGQSLADLVRDARRFILPNKWIIENAPLQAYASALVFSPTQSTVHKLFQADEPSWITLKPAVEVNWNACLQTLEGHNRAVSSVAFSPDGKQLASGSYDSNIKVWDVASGSCIQTLQSSGPIVRAIAFSSDGEQLASSAFEKIKVWNVMSSVCIKTLKGHILPINTLVFSLDKRYLASGSDDNIVKVWDVATGVCLQTLGEHSDSINTIAFSSDSRQLASGSDDYNIRIWDILLGICIKTLEGHMDSVNSVAFSPDRKYLASGSQDYSIKIWDLASGTCAHTLTDHNTVVCSLAFQLDGKRLASGSWDNSIKVWDTTLWTCIQTLQGHRSAVITVAFSPDGTYLASGSDDCSIKIWDTALEADTQTAEVSYTLRIVACSPDEKWLASAGYDNITRVWDIASGACVQTLKGYRSTRGLIAFSPDSKQLALVGDGSNVKFQDSMPEVHVHTVKMYSGSSDIVLLALGNKNPKNLGSTLYSCTEGSNKGPGMFKILKVYGNLVDLFVFSLDSKLLASGSENGIKVWDIAAGVCMRTLEGYNGPIRALAFSPDSKELASASGLEPDRYNIKIWDVEVGGCIQTLQGHNSIVSTVAFSPDGKQLASGSGVPDPAVKVWDIESGVCVQTLQGHRDFIGSVAFLPNGRQLVSASHDCSVKVWEMISGKCVRTTDTGLLLERISFERGHLLTEVGYIKLPAISSEPSQETSGVTSDQRSQQQREPNRSGYGIGTKGMWITRDGENMLWLPLEYRPRKCAVQGRTVCIGCHSSRILIMTFSEY